jgi:hypothetical protein
MSYSDNPPSSPIYGTLLHIPHEYKDCAAPLAPASVCVAHCVGDVAQHSAQLISQTTCDTASAHCRSYTDGGTSSFAHWLAHVPA